MSNKFMTVIYDVSQPEMKEKAKKLLADADWAAAGWSHAFADRDEARAALYKLQESSAAAPQVVADERAAALADQDQVPHAASARARQALAAPVQLVAVPDGWPTAEMVVRGAEQLHDCLRSVGVVHDFDSELKGTEIQQDIAESVFKSMMELAAPAAQGDAIRKVEVDDQGPLGVVTKTTYALANTKDAKDAERYRWLRDQDCMEELGSFTPYVVKGQIMEMLDGKELDAAIDAAIAAKAAS